MNVSDLLNLSPEITYSDAFLLTVEFNILNHRLKLHKNINKILYQVDGNYNLYILNKDTMFRTHKFFLENTI